MHMPCRVTTKRVNEHAHTVFSGERGSADVAAERGRREKESPFCTARPFLARSGIFIHFPRRGWGAVLPQGPKFLCREVRMGLETLGQWSRF